MCVVILPSSLSSLVPCTRLFNIRLIFYRGAWPTGAVDNVDVGNVTQLRLMPSMGAWSEARLH
jgi:hypothetical protein